MPAAFADYPQDALLSPEDVVMRIRQGAEELRSPFIARYQPFIASTTARLISAPAQGRDEYSVAMEAFNEAIDRYDPTRRRAFLSWCDLVINHRVIDFIRSSRRLPAAYPFTYFEADGNEEIVEQAVLQNPAMLVDHLEIKEEIEAFAKRLESFGIKLSDLVRYAPRHADTKAMCAMVARKVASSPEMAAKLERTGQLPITSLLGCVRIGRKAIENNRKYIIAIYIILTSHMEIIKGYIHFIEEGAKGK